MLTWIIFAVLSAAVLFAVLRPLFVAGHTVRDDDSAAANKAVYADQLREIDSDLARGVIGEDEAKSARIEVSRKLLELSDQLPSADGDAPPDGAIRTHETKFHKEAIALVVLVPLAATGLYASLGKPNLPNLPHAARMNEDINTAKVGNLLARVEARLREHPDDGRGWDVIAPFYFRSGRFGDAADAYRNANRLLGESPQRLIGYVKSAILANNGVVTEDLKTIAERLAAKLPGRAEPKFWLALAKEQDGDIAGARKAYQDLLATAKQDDPWKQMVQGRLDGLGNPGSQ